MGTMNVPTIALRKIVALERQLGASITPLTGKFAEIRLKVANAFGTTVAAARAGSANVFWEETMNAGQTCYATILALGAI